jgi:curved DNA-binding protein CbpA
MKNKQLVTYVTKLTNINLNDRSLQLFIISTPKDALVGSYSGLKNVSIGCLGGLSSIIITPIIMTWYNGGSGFIKGSLLGLLGGLVLPIAGGLIGVIQFLRGLINTPSAIYSISNGKIWDYEKEKWVIYNLNNEFNEYLFNDCIDNHFYNVLELNLNCDEETIKRKYKNLSLQYHPDRLVNKKCIDINKNFNEINAAYIALYDKETRVLYNIYGRNYKEKIDIYNRIYVHILGSCEITKLIGYSYLLTEYLVEKENYINPLLTQKKREILIAYNINSIIDNNEYKKIEEIKESLIQNPIGKMFIHLIGYIFINISSSYLGVFTNIYNNLLDLQFTIANNFNIGIDFAKLYCGKNLEDKLEVISSLIINLLIKDIENTVKNSILKLLNDSEKNNEKQNLALKLKEIGTILNGPLNIKDAQSNLYSLLLKETNLDEN